MNEENNTRSLVRLILGIVIYAVIVAIPVYFICQDKIKALLGLLLGAIIAICMVLHMNFVINRSLYMEDHQPAFMAWSAVGRLLVVCGILILAALTRFANAITMLVGLFGLKLSAYVQTLLTKKNEK